MSAIESQIIETWQIHSRTMLHLIASIPEEAFSATLSKRGGRDISRQFAHLHSVRVTRLKAFARKEGEKLTEFEKGASPDKQTIYDVFKNTGELMEKYLKSCIENGGEVSNFKRGVAPMVGYYISHEAHHRGNMLLTMKQTGHRLTDPLKFEIWEWNKI